VAVDSHAQTCRHLHQTTHKYTCRCYFHFSCCPRFQPSFLLSSFLHDSDERSHGRSIWWIRRSRRRREVLVGTSSIRLHYWSDSMRSALTASLLRPNRRGVLPGWRKLQQIGGVSLEVYVWRLPFRRSPNACAWGQNATRNNTRFEAPACLSLRETNPDHSLVIVPIS